MSKPSVGMVWSNNALIEALHVTGPTGENADKLMLFGQFVGSWDLEWKGTDEIGHEVHSVGELHFGWVLGGRAVQDIWIVPGRGQPGEGNAPFAFHGSTIRFYDPKIDAWRSTWVDPVSGRVRRFIGRVDEDKIVLLSDEETPQLRWSFNSVTSDAFVWHGEISHDGGENWNLYSQMRGKRR